MRVSELLRDQVIAWKLDGDPEVRGLAYDSRQVKPGFLFFALRGTRHDGNRFGREALERGALGAVTDRPEALPEGVPYLQVPDTRKALGLAARRFYGDPVASLTLVGITGTNGKTSTAFFLRAMLQALGRPTGLMGTVYNLTPRRREKAQLTTPESLDILAHLARIREDGGTHAVLEVSSHALAQNRVAGVVFQVGVLTNITRDHLDFHGTFEAYWRAKQRLFTRHLDGVAVLPASGLPEGFREGIESQVITYGPEENADLRLLEANPGAKGSAFVFAWRGESYRAWLPVPGRFQVWNALAALGALFALGFSAEEGLEALRHVEPAPGRFQLLQTDAPFQVVIDYAHTPDGLAHLLHAARELKPRRLIVVFGAGGDRDRGKRPLMGKVAAEGADLIVLTSDNPRTEDPLKIIEEIRAGVPETAAVQVLPDRREAIAWALKEAQPGDWVLIAGRGHEETQVVGTERRPFQDARVAAEILRNMGYAVHTG